MRHGTDMAVEQDFVDSHGASFVGFGITRLLDFDLIARFKQINTMRQRGPARSQLPEMVSACSLSAGGGGNRRGPRQPWHSGR